MGSNSLAFKTWLKDEVNYIVTPLERFGGKTIGIDAEDYLYSLLSPGGQAPEPLLPAHGGNGFTIMKRIDEDLVRFRDAGITPWFVFNGLDLASRDRASILHESRKATTTLNEAWQVYDRGEGEGAVAGFGKACTYRTYHLRRSLMFHLHSQGVQIQVAPYTAAAHLAYLESIKQVDGVQGSASCLLYGCDSVILEVDWVKKEVCWTNLPKCLTKLDLTRDQFVAVCLISGSSILPTLPELDREEVKPKIVMAARLLNSFNNDIDALLRPKENDYHKEYYRALHALKHPVQLEITGHVRPKDGEKEGVPNDHHEFVGRRLPAELYQYLCRGLVGSRILNSRARGEILETPPFDGGLSPTYRDLVSTRLRPIRAQTIGLMTSMLHRYYQKNDVQIVCWFNEPNSTPLGITERTDWQKDADTWHAKAEQRPKVSQDDILGSGLMWGVLSLAKDSDAKKTVTPRQKDAPPPLETFEDARSNIIWRFLQDRGYFKSDHTLSSWGKVLKTAFERAASDGRMATQESKAEMEDIIFLAIEMIKLDVLGTQQMFTTPPYTGGLTKGTDLDKSSAMLISRVACLGTVEHDKIGYTGPLSRNLLAYHQMTAAVRGALRDLIEAHAGYLFCSGSVQRVWNNPMYTNLAASLPFLNEPDLGLGIVVKSYLDELSSPNPAQVEAWFHHVHDIDRNLKKAWSMWEAVNAGIQAGENSIINSDTKMTFKNADSWLKRKVEHTKNHASEPNGTA